MAAVLEEEDSAWTSTESDTDDSTSGILPAHFLNTSIAKLDVQNAEALQNTVLRAKNDIAKRYARTFRGHCLLACSVGVWVTIFGLPMFSINMYVSIFGQRNDIYKKVFSGGNVSEFISDNETADESSLSKLRLDVTKYSGVDHQFKLGCGTDSVGMMRDVAPKGAYPELVPWTDNMTAWSLKNDSDIWCGYLPSSFLSYWPNVAQFIIFSVYGNTGTTINLAVQGLVGTAIAAANTELMMMLFPRGARQHTCLSIEKGSLFTVLWFNEATGWNFTQVETHAEAWGAYWRTDPDHPQGLLARATFDPDGKMDRFMQWASEWSWIERLERQYQMYRHEDCVSGTKVYDDPKYGAYGELVCMLDVLVVLFFFLISKASRNTIMFGMSWHVFWMMSLMNPAVGIQRSETGSWLSRHGSDTMAVLVTTCLGVVFAVAATFIPGARLLNTNQLYDECLSLTDSVTNVWKSSAEYLLGGERSARRYQVAKSIQNLTDKNTDVNDHIAGAWWETFDIAHFGNRRQMLGLFASVAAESRTLLEVVKKCILSETFEGEHIDFSKKVSAEAFDLVGSTSALMWLCVQASADGKLDETEVKQITAQVNLVKENEMQLLKAFQSAKPSVSDDLADEQIFVFTLGLWARKIREFANRLINMLGQGKSSMHLRLFRAICNGVQATWRFRDMSDKEHVKYAMRNWLSISVCFILGYYLHGSIFTRYNATMSSTLTLLFVKEGSHIVEYEKSTHRLLGVTLGNSLPILVAALTGFFACLSMPRFLFQATTTFLYCFAWMFMYYNSDMWGYVSCLVAGFGVYKLMEPCAGDATETEFANKYMALGNVVVAILLQAFLHSMMSKTGPQQLFLVTIKETGAEVVTCIKTIFMPGHFSDLKVSLAKSQAQITRCKALVAECAPKLQLINGRHPPFKMDLATATVNCLESLLSEIAVLVQAADIGDHDKSQMKVDVDVVEDDEIDDSQDDDEAGNARPQMPLNILNSLPAAEAAEESLVKVAKFVTQVAPAMLQNRSWAEDQLRDIHFTGQLKCANELYAQTSSRCHSYSVESQELTNDIRMRLCIVIRCLQNCAAFLGKIEEWCITESTRI